jgi:hypothetical protein
VALLSPYRPPRLTPERQAAIDHAIERSTVGRGRTSFQAR